MQTSSRLILIAFSVLCCLHFPVYAQDTPVNNLVHGTGYVPAEYGSIPSYIKKGNGRQVCILIPGFGFDASIFNDFMEANKNFYTMYAITVPGYGRTKAPPMPEMDISYGNQHWNKSAVAGIAGLIDKERLKDVVVIGHFVAGTQLALRLAIEHPDKIARVVVIGGPAKFIAIGRDGRPMPYPLDSAVKYIDNYWAPRFYKTITKEKFNEGNYLPGVYSLDTVRAARLWQQSAQQPLPVMIRYLCEFFASDITLEVDRIKCPVLVLRPSFNKAVLQNPVNNYVWPQFIDSWNKVAADKPNFVIRDIPSASAFMWMDNPADTYSSIRSFLER